MQSRQEHQKKLEINITLKTAIYLAATFAGGFLVGRVRIGETIWPFGVAYVLAAFLNHNILNPYMALGGVLASMATYSLHMANAPYCFSVVATAAALMIVAQAVKLTPRVGLALAAAAISYIGCTIAFKLGLILPILSSLIEMLITFLMVVVFHTALRLFSGRRRQVLSDEELISICFLGLLAVMGLGDFALFGIYLREAAAAYVSLFCAYIGGAAVGAGVGMCSALACVIVGTNPLAIAAYGVASLAAGACRKMKRVGVCLGFLITQAFFIFYICYGELRSISLIAMALAAAAFLVTPRAFVEKMAAYVDANLFWNREQALREERFRELTVGRLREISNVFQNTARVFGESAIKSREEGNIAYTMASIPEQACANCMFFRSCWDVHFDSTYELMQKLYAKYDSGKKLTERDLGIFSKKCIRAEKLIAAATLTFEKFNTNSKWEGKIAESRGMIGDQMIGVSRVIDSLLREVQVDIDFRDEMEDNIRLRLDEIGVPVKEICAEFSEGTLNVDLVVKGCGGKEACETKIRRAVSAACGMPMEKADGYSSCAKDCRLRYEQAKNYSLQTGIAMMPKDGSPVSGDTHSFEALKDGRYMMLLCDGMGSGERAARESRTAVTLMEDFYRANFDDKTILDAINKLLILSSSDDIFSTMDLCMVNLVEGRARFTKIGAPHSYIIGKNGMRKLDAGSLPIGILDDYEPVVYDLELEHGDIILMFTDGIADLETADDRLHQAIREAAEMRNADDIANHILSHAYAAYGAKAKDDMTVMVARVIKNKAVR